ncbi:MAG: homocysteine S-methyltransferase family protein [Clostridia bacterium]|nr:homocysteine S-methyltransferase family protein [Clostridia bacterium]
MNVREYIKTDLLIFDGAMGTMLQKAGLPTGGLPELYNIEHPEVVLDIHKKYVLAGCDVITTNTFQANAFKLKDCGHTPKELIEAGVKLAKKSGAKYVALDIGPLGQLMKPMGTLTFDMAYDMFLEQINAGVNAGADIILFETMSDLLEVKAGVLAAKENCNLPIFVTMTYQEDGRTFVGCSPECAAITLSGLGVDALGVNCSLGPKELEPIIDKLIEYSNVPVMAQPNAGLPKLKDGETYYDVTPNEYGVFMEKLAQKGVRVLGGCCGTNPDFISAMVNNLGDKKAVKAEKKPSTIICSGTRLTQFDNRITVIGERINPTGKKLLKEKLREKDFDYIAGEAISQANAGADILDVNCGLPDIDEIETLKRAVEEVQTVTNLPLQIDSSNPDAIEAAVRIYNGKPLINSVNGKKESMDLIFPIAKKYGAAVVGLTLDEKGIPDVAEERFKIAEKIIKEAKKYDIPKEDIIIDCLVLTASAQQEQVMETIKAVNLVTTRLGVQTVLGVSNVSFGLPARPLLNSTFLAAGFGAGLSSAIVNPLSDDIMKVVHSFRVLNNQDKDATEFIYRYGNNVQTAPVSVNVDRELKDYIMEGRREESKQKTKALLETQDPLKIIDEQFIPALDIVGAKYEKGELFLPQLIQAAEAVKEGFSVLKGTMPQGGMDKGTIILATVVGDIHDIGKNIVKMLLENYGYRVIDLGKDVPIETVVKEALKTKAPLIGLSALMTTTVAGMKDTISALKKAGCTAKIMVGGAVLNEDYVDFVGADFYAQDARAGVVIANKVFGG